MLGGRHATETASYTPYLFEIDETRIRFQRYIHIDVADQSGKTEVLFCPLFFLVLGF